MREDGQCSLDINGSNQRFEGSNYLRLMMMTYFKAAFAGSKNVYEGERLKDVINSNATVSYGFDALDRVISRTQTMGTPVYTHTATYEPAGLKTETYHSGRQVTYTRDGVGRVTGISGLKSSVTTNYLTAASYAAHGAPSSLSWGSGPAESWGWNYRLQPTSVGRGTGFSLSYGYCSQGGAVCGTNNGNILSQTIGHIGSGVTQSYTFDAVGRLASVSEGAAWSRNYSFDAWGNHWVSAWTGVVAPDSFTPGASSNYNTKNQLIIQSSGYDLAGNQTAIGGYSSAYDAEGRLKTSTLNQITTTMSYDGEGRRVKMVTGSRTTVFVYSVGGKLAEELDTTASAESGVRYLAVDHLGSTRMAFDGTGTVTKCLDYLPYGEQIAQGINGRSAACWGIVAEPRVKFTGKERDTETTLDYFGARYLSGVQGRWTTPDWSEKPESVPYADFEDPQTINLYSYVGNRPLNRADADGHKQYCLFGVCVGSPDSPPPPPPPPAPTNPVYPTVDTAGVAASQMVAQRQAVTGWEHAVSIYALGTGYTYTNPVTQGLYSEVDPNNTTGVPIRPHADPRNSPNPPGTPLVGDVHSHPESDRFSGPDIEHARRMADPLNRHPLYQGFYLAGPDGTVKKWVVSTHVPVVLVVGGRKR